MPASRFAFTHPVEVRFRDCDPMGHVNHAVYLTYLEQCRFAFWRHLTGASAGPGAGIIIARVECDYRAAARVGDMLEVGVNVGEIGRSSFTLTYEIANTGTGRVLAAARTVLVTYDYAAESSIPMPAATRALLEGARIQ
ncbi:MAG: acyl-CoA thioesterase [Betaproteobacteria bacterium]